MATLDQAIAEFDSGFNSDMNQGTIRKYIKEQELRDRFTAVVIRAVQENPDLLKADRKSLYYACQRAAQDGLMPDGREGFLGIYNTNAGTREAPNWIQKVQWQPMIYGLRKILSNHGYSLAAELVYEKDLEDGRFIVEKGDNPGITHRPDVFSDRGKMVGAYAIATEKATGMKYHETMNMDDLERVRMASKNPQGTVWKNWAGEMYRKAPAKRLFKQLPLPDEFIQIINRDNEQFDLDRNLNQPTSAAQAVQAAARQLEKPNPDMRPPAPKMEEREPIEAVREAEPEPPPAEEADYAGQEPDF